MVASTQMVALSNHLKEFIFPKEISLFDSHRGNVLSVCTEKSTVSSKWSQCYYYPREVSWLYTALSKLQSDSFYMTTKNKNLNKNDFPHCN